MSHINVAGPINNQTLEKYKFHETMKSFRPSDRQHQALLKISKLPEGRVFVALNKQQIIGYLTLSHSDPIESWSKGNMSDLLELGVIEVAIPYRKQNVAKHLLKLAFLDTNIENYIVFTTLYHWHWDLKNTNLTIWQYRNMMEKLFRTVGFKVYPTNDPEITSHPANTLMVRVGKNVPKASVNKFDSLRFQNS
ncbi:hypothetical protein BHF71_04165 [Vulcanibacillus modesticaldus]|uniref:N-acetyltransferase domain-containing protein n=1 Tax=Vulcanibacillus modesticaldus TaxID=337097 RepID=A0A1D2YS98_9BACI|nr:GNAT family N-acetyltransferase [Vulcanibacillus modesticaldus]OEF96930.1 hypothetical protein BHF71_04165 [Vulcanibacillus modesticaldus]